MVLDVLTADSAWPFACWRPGLLVLCSAPFSSKLSELWRGELWSVIRDYNTRNAVSCKVTLQLSYTCGCFRISEPVNFPEIGEIVHSNEIILVIKIADVYCNFFHGLSGSWLSVSLACLAEYWLHIWHWVMYSFISALMLGQNRHSWVLLRHPLVPKWELCSCFMVW